MARSPNASDGDEEKVLKANIQRRFTSMFSGEGEPLASMSVREVEALKVHLAELEAQLSEARLKAQDSSEHDALHAEGSSISKPPEADSSSSDSLWKVTRSTPESSPEPKRTFSLRTKLTLAIALTALVAVLALSYFAYARSTHTQEFLGGELQSSVQNGVEANLTNTVNTEVLGINHFLENIARDIDLTADYASQLLAEEAALSNDGYWDAKDKLASLAGGQQDNPNSDPAAVFIPKGIELTDLLSTDLNTLIHLDLVGPATLQENPDMVALYYINPQGVTVYYPNIDLANLVPPDFDVTSQVFYQIATPENNPERKNVWTPPYQDPAGTGLIVTNVSPVYDKRGSFRGVVAADIQLSKITERISSIKVGKTGYAFLIDNEGHIIAMPPRGYEDFGLTQEVVPVNESPKQSLLDIESAEYKQVFRQMTEGMNNLGRIDFHGTDHFIAYAPLPSTGYSIGLVVPAAEMNESVIQAAQRVENEARATLQYGALLLAVVLFGSVLAGTALSRVMTSPLEKLTQAARKISAGELDQTVVVTSRDEFGLLGDVFNRMTVQLHDLFTSLEKRVEERTHDLELASEVGRTVSERVHNLDEMLTEAVELIRSRFYLYYTQIYLVDPSMKNAVLRAGTGQAGKELLRRKHHLPINSGSLNGRAITEKRAVIVPDTTKSPDFLPNPLLPNTRSEMTIPLIAGGEVVGVLDMQSEQPGSLNETNLPAFEALAGQLAIAIQNAALFTATEEARAQVEAQAQRLTEQGWQDFLDGIERGQKIGYAFDQSQVVHLKPEALSSESNGTDLSVPISVIGTKIGEIYLPVEEGRAWTPSEIEFIKATSAQLAQHIENLRLLGQAERYRAEAEQAVRRLTREAWDHFQQSQHETAPGYLFDRVEVKPLAAKSNGHTSSALKQSLVVRDEVIGELAVEHSDVHDEAEEIISAVAQQLSVHLENLRLSESNMQLLEETEERAKREQALREITSALRGSTDPAIIIRTAVREVGKILSRKTLVHMMPGGQTNTSSDNGNGPDV